VSDYFALLNEPRRPWLEPEVLGQKFLALSSAVHPDRVHALGEAERAAAQARYVELNAACQCLREPKDRLRHLLELEQGSPTEEVQRIPTELMDWSLQVGRLCREADGLLAEKARTTSPLLKVQCFERGQALTENLQALQRRINDRHDRLIQDLRAVDADWDSARAGSVERAGLLRRLEDLYRLFSFFGRWQGQIRERIVQISF
jgi:DnaJ-domain-containing protein 1